MNDNLSLKEAERRAWTLYHEDGLLELFLGLLFIGGGLRTLTDSLWSYLFILAGILIFVLGRRYITLPRVGLIKFGPRRKRKRRSLFIFILVAVILTILLLLLPALGIAGPGPTAGYVFALVVPLIFAYMAYQLEFKRLYVYAVLVAIFMLVVESAGTWAGAWAQFGTGLIILIVGLWHLLHFLQNYPLPDHTVMKEGEADDESQ